MNPNQQSKSKKISKSRKTKPQFNPVVFSRGGMNTGVPFQKEYNAKITYVTPITLSGAALQSYVFRANSLFDPDYTSIGGQPYMYDQLAAIYNRYRVYNVKYQISYTNTTLDFPVVLAISADNVTGPFTVISHASTAPYSQFAMHGPYPTMTSTGIRRGKFNIAKVLGYQANIEDDLSALVTTNPNQVVYIHLTADTIPYSETFSVQCFVKLTFRATFYDLKQPNESISRQMLTPVIPQVEDDVEEAKTQTLKKVQDEVKPRMIAAYNKVKK